MTTKEAAMADGGVTDASMAELARRLSEQTATLVRQEMHLAQAELKQKGKRAGIGAGLLGAAGVVGLAALGALVAALILVLGEAVAMWISAFIVAGGLAVVAGIVALMGKRQVSAAVPPKPEATIESVQADVAEIKEKVRR
jgi:MFS family permease